MNLKDFDWVVVNSSAGKDSQAMLDVVVAMAREQGYPLSKVLVVHADLGRVEWQGTKELAELHASSYGLRFEVVKRAVARDLLEEAAHRGMWPSNAARWCTSYFKRDAVAKLHTALARELGGSKAMGRPVQILNCMGMRAQESHARAKLVELEVNKRISSREKVVTDWLPIHSWKLEQVWARIKASGLPHHKAYDLGMPRLSCCFCVFAPKPALITAGRANPELLKDYVSVERLIGHRFTEKLSIAEVADAIAAGEPGVELGGCSDNWNM